MKKVLVVGFGSIGKRHVINLLTHSNVKIIVLTKRKNIKLEKIGKQKKISLVLDLFNWIIDIKLWDLFVVIFLIISSLSKTS